MGTYLDYNASTPVHPEVIDEMRRVYLHAYGNSGSRTHEHGAIAHLLVEDARRAIAAMVGARQGDIVFTSGASESNNMATLGLAEFGRSSKRMHVISTAIEHKSVLAPLEEMRKSGFELELVKPGVDGCISAYDVLSKVRPDTLLVSIMHANNETGCIQPVDDIAHALRDTRTYMHIDAAQTCGKLVPQIASLEYDLMSITAHKMCGPLGIGALVTRRNQSKPKPPLRPLMFGGGQEMGLRPGTIPVPLVAGFGLASKLALENHGQWMLEAASIKRAILHQLAAVNYVVNGNPDKALPHVLNVSFPGMDSEALMLSLKGDLSLSNGSACNSALYEPSYVLASMGLTPEIVRSAIRISWGHGLTSVDLSPLVKAVSAFQCR